MSWWQVAVLFAAQIVPAVVVWVNSRATRRQLRDGFNSLSRNKWQ